MRIYKGRNLSVIKRLMLIPGVFLVVALMIGLPAAAHAQYVPGEPGFILDPDTVQEGGASSFVSGVGCPRDTAVDVSILGESVGKTTSRNDPDGTFETSIQIPASLGPGEYVVAVSCGMVRMTNILTVTAIPVTVPDAGGGGDLPRTGSDSMVLVRIGLMAVTLGGLLVLGARAKRARV